ncbi:hypothetical protein [Pontibacter ramchanderi]|uniref:SpoIIAA-like protein n=1 Tax=Pontibacter ramchanderi TaxID=1179743 RepID=A0A2N3V1X1_9BACT|nr:hypothetical protein [Pontibacter ramchanderi]PKV75631.1 hypothetical protein BD749_0576 [Pontibacter ramchanderi]
MKLVRNEILHRQSNILIEFNHAEGWIYVNWRGYQNYDTVVKGCEKILELLLETNCTKVLNDNTNVEGIWSGASKWVGQDWFPRMQAAGLECFAWVYSPSAFSRLSAEKSLQHTEDMSFIKTFNDIEAASDWLRAC